MDLKELIEKLKDPIEKSYCKTKKISTKKILYGIFRNYDDPDDKYQVFDCSLESIVSERLYNLFDNLLNIDNALKFLLEGIYMVGSVKDIDSSYNIVRDCNNVEKVICNIYKDVSPYPWVDIEYGYNIKSLFLQLILWCIFHPEKKMDEGMLDFLDDLDLDTLEVKYYNLLKDYFDGYENVYVVREEIQNKDELIEFMFPEKEEWDFYDSKEYFEKELECNPFEEDAFYDEMIERSLSDRCIFFIENDISDVVRELLSVNHCRVLCRGNLSEKMLPCSIFEKMKTCFCKMYLQRISSSSEDEVDVMWEIFNNIGYQFDIFNLIHRYYIAFENEEPEKGLRLLHVLADTKELQEFADDIKEFNKKRLHFRYEDQENKDKRGSNIYLLNAVANTFEKEQCISAEEAEMLHFLYQIQEKEQNISCKQVCKAFGWDYTGKLYEKLCEYGWIENDKAKVPLFIVHALTYKIRRDNKVFDFYLQLLLNFSDTLFGYTYESIGSNIASVIIEVILEEKEEYYKEKFEDNRKALHYFFDKTSSSAKKSYSVNEMMEIRKSGIGLKTTKKNNSPMTDTGFMSDLVWQRFYMASFCYCYEYGMAGLASRLKDSCKIEVEGRYKINPEAVKSVNDLHSEIFQIMFASSSNWEEIQRIQDLLIQGDNEQKENFKWIIYFFVKYWEKQIVLVITEWLKIKPEERIREILFNYLKIEEQLLKLFDILYLNENNLDIFKYEKIQWKTFVNIFVILITSNPIQKFTDSDVKSLPALCRYIVIVSELLIGDDRHVDMIKEEELPDYKRKLLSLSKLECEFLTK